MMCEERSRKGGQPGRQETLKAEAAGVSGKRKTSPEEQYGTLGKTK